MTGAIAVAGTAGAHATRIGEDPAENSELTESPSRVAATFNESLQKEFAAMTVVGPDGNLWQTGEAQVDGPVLSVAVRPLGPAGEYTVNYRVTSADGHVLNGSWKFRMTVPGGGSPGAAVTAPTSDAPAETAPGTEAATEEGVPVWPFYVGAVVAVAAAALWAVRRRG
ncbi:copper resistance CopC family protein [Mycolicibacterium phlei]